MTQIEILVLEELSDEFRCYDNAVDWEAVSERIRTAAWNMGINLKDISRFLGLNMADEDYSEQAERLPKTRTAMQVAAYMGLPASWVLMGKGNPPFKTRQDSSMGIFGTSDSTVVQGNNAGTMIIHNGSQIISEQKRELMRIFDLLPIREQTRLLNFAYQIEEDLKRSK